MAKKIYRRDIRPSQFVTTYGPGSLLRIGNMSRIMPDIGALVRDLEKLDGFSGLGEFRIYDNKLESTVKGVMELNKEKVDSVKIFRIPTNSDFRLPGNRILYNTELFPKWSICKRHKILCRLDIDENGKDYLPCSKCQNEGLEPDVGTAIRFIQACQNGHMSDINWHGEVWHKKGCNGNEFDWSEDDETFEVVCTQCKQKADYKSIRRKAREGLLKCNRHHAESGITDDDCCEIVDDKRRETGRMLLVNASNLRLAHVISSLIVPPYADRLFKILSQFEIQFLGSCKAVTKQEFLARCQSIIEYTPWLNDEIMMILDESSETKLQNTIRAVLGKQSKNSATEEQSEIDEFKVLLESSENGYPRPHSGEEPDFVVDVNKVRRGITVPGFGFKFTITPISILHVVRTQVGYRREVKSEQADNVNPFNTTGRLVPTYCDREGSKWFPGYKVRGEGILIHADNHDAPNINGKEFLSWMSNTDAGAVSGTELYYDPRFVWWHTLAHMLLTDLSISSGFQSASIAEKTYLIKDSNGNAAKAGILLYTVQDGGDGTLGGLVGLVPKFEKILEKSTYRLAHCSNDPVCIERKFNKMRTSGASCHACLLASETSCRLHNHFLDRNLVLESMLDGYKR